MSDPISPSVQAMVGRHHQSQFGNKPIAGRGMKLAEEVGELCGALVRHVEQRDGHDWLDEVRKEAGDVIVVLLTICDKLGLDLSTIARDGVDRFLARTWMVTEADR